MSPGEIHQLVCIQNILQFPLKTCQITNLNNFSYIFIQSFIFLHAHNHCWQELILLELLEIRKVGCDSAQNSFDNISYHSQLSGTKGADHLESAWDEDVLWVKVAWIFSGIAFACRLDYIRGDLNPLYTTATRKNPNTCLCKQLYLVLYILNNL